MKIVFVTPTSGSGGPRVVANYTRLLSARGHQIVLVSPPEPRRKRTVYEILRRAGPPAAPRSPLDGLGVEHLVLDRWGPIGDDDVPDADVIIATWWETAEWVAALSPAKGAKVYFVQGHEVYPWLPQARARATYRLPLQKIVISRWLEEIMRLEYGDRTSYLVPNAVDHDLFYAPPRGKQRRPTVGLLFSTTEFKGFDLTLSALESVREVFPDLRVLTFGMEFPPQTLPSFVEYLRDPPQDSLRSIYANCDAWLTASSSEGFNLPAMEAMACRTPVVATRTGWPAEAVVDGINGALVPFNDPLALAQQTVRLLGLPAEQWIRVSEQAFETVRLSTWARSADLFEHALQRASASPSLEKR